MKNLSIIIFSWFIIFLTGCSKDKSSIENDLKKENLKGDVVLVYQSNKISETEEAIVIRSYNDKGMLTKVFHGSFNQYYDIKESFYVNGIKTTTKQSTKLGNNSYQNEENYSYSSIGLLTSVNSKDNEVKYDYNEEGKLIKETHISKEWNTSKDYYYSDDKLDSTVSTSIYNNNNFNQTTVDITLENGIKSIVYDINVDGRKILSKVTYSKINEMGDIEESTNSEYESNGEILKTIKKIYEYNYDEKGNWIQKRTIEDGVIVNTVNRTIIYKGGETSIYLNQIEKIIESVESENNAPNSHSNNSNSSSNNYRRENNTQKQLVNCRDCGGQGILICKECSGNGMVKCGNCSNGTIVDQVYGGRVTCYVCNGSMRKNCNKCKGKGNDGKCYKCGGRGQVSE